jgi:hypothetical protein
MGVRERKKLNITGLVYRLDDSRGQKSFFFEKRGSGYHHASYSARNIYSLLGVKAAGQLLYRLSQLCRLDY